MNKGLLATGVIGAISLIFVSKLSAKSNAAKKLVISFKKLQIKNASFTDGILFKVFLSAINPTPTQLSFTQPFVQIFLKNENGDLSPIASSVSSTELVVLGGRKDTPIEVELKLPLIQALKLPKLLGYLVTQFVDKQAKKTKKIVVAYSTTAEGFNISDKWRY